MKCEIDSIEPYVRLLVRVLISLRADIIMNRLTHFSFHSALCRLGLHRIVLIALMTMCQSLAAESVQWQGSFQQGGLVLGGVPPIHYSGYLQGRKA